MFSNQPQKGMTDYTPEKMQLTEFITDRLEEIVQLYGYHKYDGPVLEPIEIFAAKSSEELVREQSYSFTDKGGRELIMRPEMTPTLARMISANHLQYPRPIRWYSIPTCYRYERPQRGRMREFRQINVDILGLDSVAADFEIFSIIVHFLSSFGATPDMFKIRYSNRRFIDALLRDALKFSDTDIAGAHKIIDKRDKLPADKLRELALTLISEEKANHLEKICAGTLDEICAEFSLPETTDGLSELKELQEYLNSAEIAEYAAFDPAIIRGLDYYTGTVFEVYDTGTENRRALFGGGRYDNLTTLFSKERISGTGFGMGVLMVELFLDTYKLIPEKIKTLASTTCYFIAECDKCLARAIKIAEKLRRGEISAAVDYNTGKIGKSITAANKRNVQFVCIIAGNELSSDTVMVKNMKTGVQLAVAADRLEQHIMEITMGGV